MRHFTVFIFVLGTVFSLSAFAVQTTSALKIFAMDQYAMDNGCGREGAGCTFSSDCCNNNCNANHICGKGAFCKGVGASCSFDSDCCTNICNFGSCSRSHSGECKATGEHCTFDSDCCDNNCNANRICGKDAFCKGGGDSCYFSSDCCSNYCTNNRCD